ncbi:MAG: flavodoxin domain-containing protein [Peptostreptococcaceae bacterium]
MKKVSIIYATMTGNTEEIAGMIKDELNGFDVNVINVSNATDEDVTGADLVLFGSSTWGYGDVNDEFVGYYDNMSKELLEGKEFAVFGCGDSIGFSDVFCHGAEAINDKAIECGGVQKAETLKIDFYESDKEEMVKEFAEALKK